MSGEVLEEEISEISIDNIGVNEEIETCESQEPQTSKSEVSAYPSKKIAHCTMAENKK